MKNKLIEQKLTRYAEAVKPDNRVIQAAVLEMRAKKQWQNARAQAGLGGYSPPVPIPPAERPKPGRRGLYVGLGAAAMACVLFVSLIVYFAGLIDSGKTGPSDPSAPKPLYNLSQLTYETATIEEVKGIKPILTLDIAEMYTNGRLYYAAGGTEPAVISVLYKTVGSGGLDEIVVIADLNGGLKDYTGYKKHAALAVGDTTVNRRQRPVNGEYDTEAYFTHGGVDYYIKISSPSQGGAEHYIALLLSGA